MSASHTAHSGESHGSLKSYLTGFTLAVILTAIPFAMVMSGDFSQATTLTTIVALAVIQMIVHLIYFLHMNDSSDGGWNMMAFIFAVIVVGIVVGGSLWVLHNMNANMMGKMSM